MSRAQRRVVHAMARMANSEASERSIEEQRAGFAAMMALFEVPSEVRVSESVIGGVRAALVEPLAAATAATPATAATTPDTAATEPTATNPAPGTILYFHGGSYAFGSPETAMGLTASLVVRSGVRSLSLDYRLAPEHPFPAANDDCLAAYRALLDDGKPPGSIVFAGDSAGAGLAVTTCLTARSAGLPMPAGLVAFSAGVDHTYSGESMNTKDGVDPFFTAEGMRRGGQLYLAGCDPHHELLSPVVCADFAGFPPMLLQVGGNELLLDDSVRLAARARDAGVDVILDVTAGVPHVFQSFIRELDEAGEALDRAALFIRQRLRLSTPR